MDRSKFPICNDDRDCGNGVKAERKRRFSPRPNSKCNTIFKPRTISFPRPSLPKKDHSKPWCRDRDLGLKNLGNSCYLNSVLQLLFHLPKLAQRYAGDGAPVVLPVTAAATATNTTTTTTTTPVVGGGWKSDDAEDDKDNVNHSNHQDSIFHAVPAPQAPDHVLVQTAKLVTGIYSQPTDKDDDDH
ncbi:hypothetical protein ACA910_022380 [Epithemia clementina (nom. ined.)]